MALGDIMRIDPHVSRIITDPKITAPRAVERIAELGYTTSKSAVKRARKSNRVQKAGTPSKPLSGVGTGKVDVTPTGGEFTDVVLDKPIHGDWSHIFEMFNLDPDEFEIIDDTVRSSTWQQSKGTEDGQRDLVQLYSYSCRFRLRSAPPLSDEDIEELRKHIRSSSGKQAAAPKAVRDGSTFVVCWADVQIGKADFGGTPATVERFLEALKSAKQRFADLKSMGHNIERIAVLNMGDPIEGCSENYPSQTFTVEMNLRQQLNLVLELFTAGINELSTLAPVTYATVLCNHGEWNRRNGKAYTGDADNASGFIGDTLARVFADRSDVDFVTPEDEMVTTLTLSGVPVALTHGHKMNGTNPKAENAWLQSQSIRLLRETRHEPRLWITAHLHHAAVVDYGAWFRIQCSSLDGGSKWFTDMSGLWSTPGVTTFLAGKHFSTGFSNYEILC